MVGEEGKEQEGCMVGRRRWIVEEKGKEGCLVIIRRLRW